MMTEQDLWPVMAKSLENALEATRQLKDVISREHEALENRQYSDFADISATKLTLITTIEQQSAQRSEWFRETGFADEQSALLAAQRRAPMVASQWQQLVTLWQECQHQNAVNERIAQRTKLVVGQLLDLLRGQNHRERLYDAKGNATPSSGGRPITSA